MRRVFASMALIKSRGPLPDVARRRSVEALTMRIGASTGSWGQRGYNRFSAIRVSRIRQRHHWSRLILSNKGDDRRERDRLPIGVRTCAMPRLDAQGACGFVQSTERVMGGGKF